MQLLRKEGYQKNMMDNLKVDEFFDKYVELYKQLSLNDKRKIALKEIKELLGFFSEINRDNGNSMLYNREILDAEKEDVSEDDFAEAVFVYINSLKELIGDYFARRNL